MTLNFKASSIDLFSSLIRFQATESRSSQENFLSDLFGYVLRTSPGARDAWVSLILGRPVRCDVFRVTTRATERNEDNRSLYPDLQIEGTLRSGEAFAIISEHKWDSPFDYRQMLRYLGIAAAKQAVVCFIGCKQKQLNDAKKSKLPIGRICLWEDVFTVLHRVDDKSEVLKEFLAFMTEQALDPGKPLSMEMMDNFVKGMGFIKALERLAHMLLNEFEWDCVPSRYKSGPEVKNRFGRVAVEFATPDWKPTLSLGFLYDLSDYRVDFVDASLGIDIVLRLEAGSKGRGKLEAFKALIAEKREALRTLDAKVLVTGEKGLRNANSMLILQHPLGSLIQDKATENQQIDSIQKKFESWIKVLYDDGQLEAILTKEGLVSGLEKVKATSRKASLRKKKLSRLAVRRGNSTGHL